MLNGWGIETAWKRYYQLPATRPIVQTILVRDLVQPRHLPALPG